MQNKLIRSVNFTGYRTVFGTPRAYGGRYEQLIKALQDPKLSQLFCAPRYLTSQNRIDFLSPLEGEPISYINLPPQEQKEVLGKLVISRRTILDKFQEVAGGKVDGHSFDDWFEIPSEEFIYGIKTSLGLEPVITMWGSLESISNPNSGIINGMLPPEDYPIRVGVNFPNDSFDNENIKIRLEKEGEVEETLTKRNGIAYFNQIRAFHEEIFTITAIDYDVSESFSCDKNQDSYDLLIDPKTNLSILVENQNGYSVSGVKIAIGINGHPETELTRKPDASGIIRLKDIFSDKDIYIKYYEKDGWTEPVSYDLSSYPVESANTQIIRLSVENHKTLGVYDDKNQAISNLDVKVLVGNNQYDGITDENGEMDISFCNPDDHIKVIFSLDDNNKKIHQYDFNITDDKDDYEIKVHNKKISPLIGLIPLLLILGGLFFFPFLNDKLCIDTFCSTDETVIDNADVRLSYFINTDENKPRLKDTLTNKKGHATFSLERKISVYQKLFGSYPKKDEVRIYRTCYQHTTIRLSTLKRMKNNKILLSPTPLYNSDFVIKSAKDSTTILPDAKIELLVKYHEEIIKVDTVKTSGGFKIKELPLCSEVFVVASMKYYTSDTINWVFFKDIEGKLERRTLYLTPELEEKIFFVKNTMNKSGVVGADVLAHIESPNKVIDTLKRVVAPDGSISLPLPDAGSVYLECSHLGYQDTTFTAQIIDIKNSNIVKDVTVWMRPKTLQMNFTVLDTITMKPIVFAGLDLRCDSVLVSQANTDLSGIAYLGNLRIDCNINLSASHPDYLPKEINRSFNFFNSDSQNRVIYLRPKPPAGIDTKDCSDGNRVTKETPYDRSAYFMGKNKGEFLFEYFTDSQPDQITILCGTDTIFNFHDSTVQNQSEMVSFDGCNYIEVVVKGSSNWNYKINCP